MRVPSVGWAFFGLAVVVLIGYVLNRGIFIGSDIQPDVYATSKGVGVQYKKYCRYLHFTGIREDFLTLSDTAEEADKSLCSMFDTISN
jgi:hypothetical protein